MRRYLELCWDSGLGRLYVFKPAKLFLPAGGHRDASVAIASITYADLGIGYDTTHECDP